MYVCAHVCVSVYEAVIDQANLSHLLSVCLPGHLYVLCVVCVHVCAYVCVHVRAYVCVYVCVCVSVGCLFVLHTCGACLCTNYTRA